MIRANRDGNLPSTRKIGQNKEYLAELHLSRQGLVVVARNYYCRRGEIDLIMRDQNCLVFVEVRFRASLNYGNPQSTVTKRKQQRLIYAAQHFLHCYPHNLPCRFDVIAITSSDQIQWIKHAFNAH